MRTLYWMVIASLLIDGGPVRTCPCVDRAHLGCGVSALLQVQVRKGGGPDSCGLHGGHVDLSHCQFCNAVVIGCRQEPLSTSGVGRAEGLLARAESRPVARRPSRLRGIATHGTPPFSPARNPDQWHAALLAIWCFFLPAALNPDLWQEIRAIGRVFAQRAGGMCHRSGFCAARRAMRATGWDSAQRGGRYVP